MKRKIYEKRACLGEKWISDVFEKENTLLREKIGKSFCVETKSLLNSDCVRYEKYKMKNYYSDLKKLKKTFNIDLYKMKQYKKGHSFSFKENQIICQDEQGLKFI